LQSVIANAVKESDSDCNFVDVIIDYTNPGSKLDANWFIRGIRFGKSDRQKASQAIAVIVEQLQREFNLSEKSGYLCAGFVACEIVGAFLM
jgi:polysaccharide pyruvyl transferase WcaK-like protein